jgi:hypothetical protein
LGGLYQSVNAVNCVFSNMYHTENAFGAGFRRIYTTFYCF